MTFFYLTKLRIMCFYVFGMSETYNPANEFSSVAVPCGRQRLVLARLALCSWEKYRQLALGVCCGPSAPSPLCQFVQPCGKPVPGASVAET